MVLSTHILPEVEAICPRVIMIHEGRKVLDQSLAELTSGGRRLEEVFARVTLGEGGAAGSAPAAADAGEEAGA